MIPPGAKVVSETEVETTSYHDYAHGKRIYARITTYEVELRDERPDGPSDATVEETSSTPGEGDSSIAEGSGETISGDALFGGLRDDYTVSDLRTQAGRPLRFARGGVIIRGGKPVGPSSLGYPHE